jgi:hypothetical protein
MTSRTLPNFIDAHQMKPSVLDDSLVSPAFSRRRCRRGRVVSDPCASPAAASSADWLSEKVTASWLKASLWRCATGPDLRRAASSRPLASCHRHQNMRYVVFGVQGSLLLLRVLSSCAADADTLHDIASAAAHADLATQVARKSADVAGFASFATAQMAPAAGAISEAAPPVRRTRAGAFGALCLTLQHQRSSTCDRIFIGGSETLGLNRCVISRTCASSSLSARHRR